jgi:restriction system protein
MSTIPWERTWLRVTPEKFEQMVVEYLHSIGRSLKGFRVRHQSPVASPDGEFEIDAVATFEALGGEYLVLVECKHHKNPIKRELVQVLSDKVSSARAQKGMLFSTASFQRGAIDYALSRRIALVHFTEGGPIFETRAQVGPQGPNRPYDAYFVTQSAAGGMRYRFGAFDEVPRILFESEAPANTRWSRRRRRIEPRRGSAR